MMFYDAVGVSPFDEVDAHAGVLLTAAAQEGHAEVLGLAPRPGTSRAGVSADAAADAFFDVADGAVLIHLQGFDGELFALLDAGTAADAARRVELGLGHADDAKVMHADLAAVVGAARESDFDVKVIGGKWPFQSVQPTPSYRSWQRDRCGCRRRP